MKKELNGMKYGKQDCTAPDPPLRSRNDYQKGIIKVLERFWRVSPAKPGKKKEKKPIPYPKVHLNEKCEVEFYWTKWWKVEQRQECVLLAGLLDFCEEQNIQWEFVDRTTIPGWKYMVGYSHTWQVRFYKGQCLKLTVKRS